MQIENATAVDRCKCGKLLDDHFIDYENTLFNILYDFYKPGLCEEGKRDKRYTPMTPLELSVWIEEQYEQTEHRTLPPL